MKRIQDLSDCSVYVVFDKKGQHEATVQFRWAQRYGAVQCDVYSKTPDNASVHLTHQNKACGGGYDKQAAALAGAVIAGVRLANHCGHSDPKSNAAKDRLLKAYKKAYDGSAPYDQALEARKHWDAKAKKIGCRWANWRDGEGWTSLHFQQGLERLSDLGYTVRQVL